MAITTFKIWRGDRDGGEFHEYKTDVTEGMVVPGTETPCEG